MSRGGAQWCHLANTMDMRAAVGIWNMEYQSNTSHRDVSVRCWWDKGMILQDIAKTSTFFDQVTTEGFAETMGSGVFCKWFAQYGACHYHCCLYNLLVRVVYVCCVEELQCRCIVKVWICEWSVVGKWMLCLLCAGVTASVRYCTRCSVTDCLCIVQWTLQQ